MKDCTTCKYGYEDERLGIPMCHHPKRFSEDCVDFNMHEEKEKPVPKDLEEAAKKFVGYDMDCDELRDYEIGIAAFIAGAKWQAEHAPLPEDTVLFNKGVAEGKRLMMEEAVEGEVENATLGIVYLRKNLVNEGYSTGDKVRIIICKKED